MRRGSACRSCCRRATTKSTRSTSRAVATLSAASSRSPTISISTAFRFTDTTSHTSDVDGAEFGADLDRFVRVCRVVRGLKNARIGSIGARTGAFQTMRFSEKLLQASGFTVVTVDLSEIIFAAKALGDDDWAVKAKLKEIAAYGRIPATSSPTRSCKPGEVDDRGRSLDRRQ